MRGDYIIKSYLTGRQRNVQIIYVLSNYVNINKRKPIHTQFDERLFILCIYASKRKQFYIGFKKNFDG